jgi:uncharacterized protein (DUF488 family)
MQAESRPTFFTIGYGGRSPSEFIRLLVQHGIRTLVDVRLKPNRASMGSYVKAKTPGKGIERLLGEAGIRYLSLPELGNPFLVEEDWQERYRRHLQAGGEALLKGLEQAERPFCLMCAEKRVADCHRQAIAEVLVAKGWEAMHIE